MYDTLVVKFLAILQGDGGVEELAAQALAIGLDTSTYLLYGNDFLGGIAAGSRIDWRKGLRSRLRIFESLVVAGTLRHGGRCQC